MSDKVFVTVKQGKVRGIKEKSKYSNAEFYSFFGIPYGQPPTGKLQFKDPVKAKPWNTTYDATSTKPGCIQFSLVTTNLIGNEDCLFVNVHTPELPSKNTPLKAVIVNIHPGALIFGTPNPDHYGSPDYIMHHDIVYVCIAYRLHMLGFLNLKLEECSGNQGIKDIILGLKWIKDNISSFGGDPENITLLGSSSGSTIINILMISPTAKGLFHKAVMMGLHFTTPVVPYEETNEDQARAIAIILGYEGDLNDNKKLLSFFKKQDLLRMILLQRESQHQIHLTIAPVAPTSVFLPTIDGTTVLPESPRQLMKSISKIPLMVGFCERESVMGFTRNLKKNVEERFNTSFRQNCFSWGHNLSDEDVTNINKEVESFYTKGEPIETASLSLKVDIQTDIMLSDVYDSLIDPVAVDSPVFVYKFNFEGALQTIKFTLSKMLDEPLEGTFHGTDYSYWSHICDPQDNETKQMIETFTKLITTFAKTGNPNYENFPVQWRPSTPEKHCYLSLNKSITMNDGKLNHERSEFWHNIVKRYKN